MNDRALSRNITVLDWRKNISEEEFEAEDDPYGNGMLVYVYVGD